MVELKVVELEIYSEMLKGVDSGNLKVVGSVIPLVAY